VKDAKQGETYLSSEGVGVLAGLLIIGAILLWVTGSRAVTVVVFLIAGIGLGVLAWMRRARSAPAGQTAARSEPPTPRPQAPAPEPARSTSLPETPEPPEPPAKADEPDQPAAPAALPPSAARLLKALEARRSEGVIGQTVRVETLIQTDGSLFTLHLVVSGDGPQRDLWFGRDGEPLPDEILIGRMPPGGIAAVAISSKVVSAQQARLSQHEGGFLIENLSKTNATRVGGRALQEGERRALAEGDLIEMGPVSIRYHLE
jgi:uncharacterized membrane protein